MLVLYQFFQANHIQNNSLPLVCSWQVERGCLDKIASATVVSVGEAYQDEEARHGHHWLSEAENKRLRQRQLYSMKLLVSWWVLDGFIGCMLYLKRAMIAEDSF